uniref:Uncharacterized protein n=1 Tax=Micrurus surinamensis TaxID=129470 RepID=A0A2D4Q4E4_MICSU
MALTMLKALSNPPLSENNVTGSDKNFLRQQLHLNMQQKLQAFTDHSWWVPCLIILLYFVMFTISYVSQDVECGKEVLKTENINNHHVKYHSDQKSAGRCMP